MATFFGSGDYVYLCIRPLHNQPLPIYIFFFCCFTERRIRERNLREHGKGKNRDQLAFQFLRESSDSTGSRRGTDHISSRLSERGRSSSSRDQTPLLEDDTRFKKFLGWARAYAVKSKEAFSNYNPSKAVFTRRGRGGDKDDVLELLPPGATGGSSLDVLTRPSGNNDDFTASGRNRKNTREPPKALFDDI